MKFLSLFSCLSFLLFASVCEANNSLNPNEPIVLTAEQKNKGYKVALLGGGCFWCLEPAYEHLDGVIEASVGYSGGKKETANYYDVSGGSTNHLETVRIVYDPKRISYKALLDIYWRFIDPTDAEGQYDDRGTQYSTAIFYHDTHQKIIAENSRRTLATSGKYTQPIATKIIPAQPFYLAEERHQNFYEKRFPSSKTVQ